MLFQIPIPDLKKPPVFQLPRRCVNCGRTNEESLSLMFNTGEQFRGKQVKIELIVPMCKTCADKERSIATITYIPFLVVGLVFGTIAFVPAMLMAPQGESPQTVGFPLIFGGLVGLIVGSIMGTVAEVIVKSLAVVHYGKLLSRRPLTAFALFSETDELLGFSGRLFRDRRILQLEIENEDIAREFAHLNQLEIR